MGYSISEEACLFDLCCRLQRPFLESMRIEFEGEYSNQNKHIWTLVDMQVHNQIQNDPPRMIHYDKVLC